MWRGSKGTCFRDTSALFLTAAPTIRGRSETMVAGPVRSWACLAPWRHRLRTVSLASSSGVQIQAVGSPRSVALPVDQSVHHQAVLGGLEARPSGAGAAV